MQMQEMEGFDVKEVSQGEQIKGVNVKEIDQENWITEVGQNASNSLMSKKPKDSRR